MQRIILLTLLFIIATSAVPGSAGAADATKVTILPFEAHDAGKYEVLKDGLKSMISARLASQENIVVVTPELGGDEQKILVADYPEKTAALFKKLDVDFIGTGRMALVEDTLQFQMTFYSAKGTPPIRVTGEAQGDSQILPTLEIIVLQIEDRVFGLKQDSMVAEVGISGKNGYRGIHDRTSRPTV
jgi:TolB-like protein